MNSNRRPKIVTSRRALLRIGESARRELEKLVFRRHPNREWGTFIRLGYRRTSWGILLCYVDSNPPEAGDLDALSDIVSFKPGYIRKALKWYRESELATGVIHSHPAGGAVFPSRLDDDMDTHFASDMFGKFFPDRPYVSLIVNRSDHGNLTFSGRVFVDGEWLSVSTLSSAGSELLRFHSDLLTEKIEALSPISRKVLERWTDVVGESPLTRLKGAIVGVIGCSGTGSPAIEKLARAQVGEFVLVEPKLLSFSNIERVHGSKISDLESDQPPHKLQLMARLIRDVNPDAKITLVAGNSLDPIAIDELVRCDVVLGCTDSVHGRVHAGDLASRYMVPVIDVGVKLAGSNDRISTQLIEVMQLTPESACPLCRNRIDPLQLNRELMPPEEVELRKAEAKAARDEGRDPESYWEDAPQLPSVGHLTTIAGSLIAGYALNWILGKAEMPHEHFQFDIGQPKFGFVPINREIDDTCSCVRYRGWADQSELSITRPDHFPEAEIAEELVESKGSLNWLAKLSKLWRTN